MSPIRSLLDRLLSRLTQIGADPQDDDDTRASKTLLVLISVLILPVSLLWAALYLAFGSPVGWVPLVYFAILLAAIVVFSRTGDFGRFLLIGQIAILLAPTLSMIPLGGFLESGGSACGGFSRRSGRSCSATFEPRFAGTSRTSSYSSALGSPESCLVACRRRSPSGSRARCLLST